MKRPLLFQLVLPLVLATAVSLLIHLRWPADGFFLNLAAGFVGSLVTVGYIDWILQRHERERWKDADDRISMRIRQLAASTITGVRVSFGFGTDVFDQHIMATGSPEKMQAEVLRVAINILSPTTDARIAALDVSGWKRFGAHLKRMSDECGVLLDRFGYRLQPATVTIVLDLQQALDSAQTYLRVFPDLAGVPAVDLPATKTPPEELQAAWCELSARDTRRLLECAAQLSHAASAA